MLQQVDKGLVKLSHCPPNPTLEYAESISITSDVTDIISVGGGSTIDVGKWLAHKYKLRHTAVPTTAGTGSEVTKYCVLMVDGKKKTYDLREPDSYILDPRMVVTLPELHTLSSGLDALCQAYEASWSTRATPESSSYASLAINLILNNLKLSMEYPGNELLRMNMLIAANFSGRAINITRTNICHAISYPLTELYGIPHGIACAMTLEYFAKKVRQEELDMFFLQFQFPKYPIDRYKVASLVMGNEKLLSYPHQVTRDDIIKAII